MPWRLQLEKKNLWLFQQEPPLQPRKVCKVWFSWAHTTLQPQGEHIAITQRSHLCFLVLIPSFKKDLDGIERKGKNHPKNLTFGCLPLDVQPKRGTAAVPRWHLTITEPKAKLTITWQSQIMMGDGSQESQEEPPNSLAVSRSEAKDGSCGFLRAPHLLMSRPCRRSAKATG